MRYKWKPNCSIIIIICSGFPNMVMEIGFVELLVNLIVKKNILDEKVELWKPSNYSSPIVLYHT